MIYIAGWAIIYFFLLLPDRLLRKKYGAFIALALVGCIIVLRGNVGPDTAGTYVPMVEQLDSIKGVEPLFMGLLHILVPLFPTPLLTVTVGLGSVYLIITAVYIYRADEKELFVLMAFHLPAGCYFETISGQRYGIAVSILLIAVQCVRLKQAKSAAALCLIAFFTHYSSAEFIVLWAGCLFSPRSVRNALMFFGGGLLGLITIVYAQTYLASKASLYLSSGFDRPSSYSGLSSVLVVLVLYSGIAVGSLPSRSKKRIILLTGPILIACWIIGNYSYAALRLIGLVEGVIPYAVLSMHEDHHLEFGPKIKTAILLAGLMAAGFTYRDMLNEPDAGTANASPSLPYHWYWED